MAWRVYYCILAWIATGSTRDSIVVHASDAKGAYVFVLLASSTVYMYIGFGLDILWYVEEPRIGLAELFLAAYVAF